MKFKIEGGVPLKGTIRIAGSKNAALPIICATLLTAQKVVLENVPEIIDVEVLLEILKEIGAKVEKLGPGKISLQTPKILDTKIDPAKATKLRASILCLGPLLGRHKKVIMPHPGGCFIGKRPIDTHLLALEKLAIKIVPADDSYICTTEGLVGAEIFLNEVSVTATENVVMAAVLAKGKTIIKNAACEPHVIDLTNFLRKLGAKISGAGTHTIEIEGVGSLSGTDGYCIHNDEVEAGTFLIAAAATGGEITLTDINPEYLDAVIEKLRQMGVDIKVTANKISVKRTGDLQAIKIQTNTYPGLPTDLQAPLTVLATQGRGQCLIHDWLYERRFGYLEDLIRMGAKIDVIDAHRILVHGPTKLHGEIIDSLDIRAGIALVIAALAAQGKSEINQTEIISRGYQNLAKRLQGLGARIVEEQ